MVSTTFTVFTSPMVKDVCVHGLTWNVLLIDVFFWLHMPKLPSDGIYFVAVVWETEFGSRLFHLSCASPIVTICVPLEVGCV